MTSPNFDPFEPIWREIRDSFRATVPQIRMAPQIRLLLAFRLLPEI